MLRTKAILIAALVVLTCTRLVDAQSQPPTPTEASQPQQVDTTGREEPSTANERDAEAEPPVVKVAATQAAGSNAAQNHEEPEEESATDWWLVVFTGIVAFFTVVLAVSTIGLWVSTYRISRHSMASERAYVTMSHKPPGLDVIKQIGHAIVTIEIKNYGRTPATVIDVLLQLDWFGEQNPPPDRPVYRTDKLRSRIGVFLATQTHFFHMENLPIPDNNDSADELWLYGYVEYVDTFKRRHRAGYARTYRDDRAGRPDEGNNLVFVDKEGWNDDYPID